MKKIQQHKFDLWLVHIVYVVLIGLSIYFYQERLLSDTSYYFFKTINTNAFHIEHQRFVLAIAEFPILLLAKLGCSLKIIAIGFSIWHYLFFYIMAFWAYKITLNTRIWYLFLMLQFVGIQYGFLCPIFEQFYGTALAIVFFALLQKKDQLSILSAFILMGLGVLIITSHPFNVILFLFMLALDFLSKRFFKIYLPFIALIPFYIYFKIKTASTYESDKMNWIFDVQHNKTYQLLIQHENVLARLHILQQHYLDLIIIAGMICLIYLWQKQFLKLLLYLFSMLFVLLLANFSYVIDNYSRYHEQVYYLLVPVTLLPIFFDFIMNVRSAKMYFAMISLLVVGFAYRIQLQVAKANEAHLKINTIHNLVKAAQLENGCKFYVLPQNASKFGSHLDWDTPYFTLMYSVIHEFPEQVSVYVQEEEMPAFTSIEPDSFWFRLQEKQKIATLNKQYFLLYYSNYSELR